MNLIARIESGMTTAADATLVRRVVEAWKTKKWTQEQLARCNYDTDRQVWADCVADDKLAAQALRNALDALEADDDETP